MLRNLLLRLQSNLFVDGEEVNAYRNMIPSKVYIQYRKDKDVYIAYVDKVDDKKIKGLLITEAKSTKELQDNLNQLIYMNAKIPEKIRPYYGNAFNFPLENNLQKAGELTLLKA